MAPVSVPDRYIWSKVSRHIRTVTILSDETFRTATPVFFSVGINDAPSVIQTWSTHAHIFTCNDHELTTFTFFASTKFRPKVVQRNH